LSSRLLMLLMLKVTIFIYTDLKLQNRKLPPPFSRVDGCPWPRSHRPVDVAAGHCSG
jgi:hypothetical protein